MIPCTYAMSYPWTVMVVLQNALSDATGFFASVSSNAGTNTSTHSSTGSTMVRPQRFLEAIFVTIPVLRLQHWRLRWTARVHHRFALPFCGLRLRVRPLWARWWTRVCCRFSASCLNWLERARHADVLISCWRLGVA